MSNPRPALRCSQVTVQNFGGSHDGGLIFPIGGGEATNPVNMEGLYVFIRSGSMEEEDNIPFP